MRILSTTCDALKNDILKVMVKKNQSISIVVPVYNRAKIISATLDSILLQNYQEWECIVVDDNSTDDTRLYVQKYVNKDARFRLLNNERKKGAQGARNTGIISAKYEWVICFDSDNIMHSDMLEKLVNRIDDGIDVIQCFSRMIDSNTGRCVGVQNWICEGDIHKKLFFVQGPHWETYVDFNQSIVRKNKLLEIGLLDEDCPSMQEWDTHIRLSNIARYITLKEPLLDYYLNGADAITTDKKREVLGRIYILKKYKLEWNIDKKVKWRFLFQIYLYVRRCVGIQYRIKVVFELMKIEPLIFFVIVYYWENKIIHRFRN